LILIYVRQISNHFINYSTGGADDKDLSGVPTPRKEDFDGAAGKNPVSLFACSTPMGLPPPPPAASNGGDGGGMSTAQWKWLTEAIVKIDRDNSTMASEMATLRVS
jgi:hypothetical protein